MDQQPQQLQQQGEQACRPDSGRGVQPREDGSNQLDVPEVSQPNGGDRRPSGLIAPSGIPAAVHCPDHDRFEGGGSAPANTASGSSSVISKVVQHLTPHSSCPYF